METQTTGTASAVAGLIAAAGPTGLRLLTSDGAVINEMFPNQVVTQPTWSRDGSRLAVTLTDPTTGTYQTAVVDMGTMEVATEAARRHYFFYSWSHDGSRLAALGPGSSGGTAVDILNDDGSPASATPLEGLSMYVAWEPGGRRLLLHAGPQLLLIPDPDTPGDLVDLGLVGADFQAPAWVPGTHDFLYVDSIGRHPGDNGQQEPDEGDAAGPQLLRRGADSGEITSLGPVGGFTLMAVHPDGDRVALSLLPVLPSLPDPINSVETAFLTGAVDPPRSALLPRSGAVQAGAQGLGGSVEIVDLDTGERLTALDRLGLWLEWSPDGRSLLMAARGGGGSNLTWHVWDGEASYELARFAPSEAFARNYLPFADQFTETPRLWSPDSAAIVFGARTAGGPAIALARLDDAGRATNLGPADVSFWSPAPPNASSPATE